MASYQYVFVMDRLSKSYAGGRPVLEDIRLSFLPGAKIGVVGSNGAGKSTLLRIMAGVDTSFQGEAWAADGATRGFLPQEPVLDPDKDVQGNVMEAVTQTQALLRRFEEVSARFAEPLDDDAMTAAIEEQAALQERIDALDAWDLDARVEMAMDALRCPPGDMDVARLSGGERRRVALCRLLLAQPDLLLLDEPTNHLDVESVAWLEQYLRTYPGAVVLVTHDRYFLDNVTGWILELDRGRGIPWEGNYSSWLERKGQRLEARERSGDDRRRELARELEWIRSAPSARRKKSKARLAAYAQMAEAAEQARASGRAPSPRIIIPPGPRLGGNVIEAQGLTKGFDGAPLMEDASFRLPPGGIVGVVGPNGAGKTTLFRMIAGEDAPDSGTLTLGESVALGYVNQERSALDPARTVWEEISGGADVLRLGAAEVQSRAYVAAFNFRGADQQQKVGHLSGGGRNRVHLAKVLKSGANLLLLDEPTNDLDIDTLRALEEALLAFAGCALIISHDRWFLDRVATHILAFEGGGHVEWFAGDCSAYEADHKRRAPSAQPRRGKFKRFSR